MRRLVYLLPVLLFLVVAGYFFLGLQRDPGLLPSALIDKPAPSFELPGLGAKPGIASADLPAVIAPAPRGCVTVRFATWPRAAAPGQAVDFYDGEVVLGGGVIADVRMPGSVESRPAASS